jgi:tetratricopeptide (TPR) repeat protein
MELYRQILKAKPKYAEAYTNLANALSEKGKSEEAIENYRKALQLNPKSALRHTNLAWELKKANQFNEALEHFSEALRLKPDSVSGLCGMAQVLIEHPDPKLRDANKAVELAKSAAELTKYQDAKVLETLATAYQALGKGDQAATILSNFGDTLDQKGKIDAAIKYYKKAIEFSPNFAIAHGRLGLALAKKGKTEEAIKEFRIVLKQRPDDADMYCNIGILLEKQGKIPEAIQEYQQALKYNPEHKRAGKLLQATSGGRND